jgi:hypothetical protein
MFVRRIRALQRFRLRLRRLRKCFSTWAAASQLQNAVLAVLSTRDSQHFQDSARTSFVRVCPQVHASVQTSCIRPSVHILIYRLATRSLLPFLLAWKRMVRCCFALRRGRKLICARVMRFWTCRRNTRTYAHQYETEGSDLCNDERLWSEITSPKSVCSTSSFPGRASFFSTSNKDAFIALVSSTTAPVSRK